MHISELTQGKKARIIRIEKGDPVYRHKLISMGLLPGTELLISRIAPLGDPVEITIRGFALSLRKYEANMLILEEIFP